MSELGFHKTGGSSIEGLTFVRPLPHAANPPQDASGNSSVGAIGQSLNERLFPPQRPAESGSQPGVTGMELGHFVIEERIGRGGMGAVFRAIDKRLDRVVALKVLAPEFSNDHDAVLRFQNEARAAARLDHDNIARVHFTGSESGIHFIAFEFVTGTNIRALIVEEGRLAPAEAVNFTLQIAEALRHTSAANVVHRDIKPSNIIVSGSGRAKLVDLGLARHLDPEGSRDLTVAGTALGTFDYISPEQAMDARNVDVRSDIYSLGCSLFHMLTGSPPYPSGTMFEKVMNHHRPIAPDPAQQVPNISPQLSRIVQKMMCSNPDERYATPDLLIADLIQEARLLGLEPRPADSFVWSQMTAVRPRSRWQGIPTWTSVALLLVVLVFADRLRFTQQPTRIQDEVPQMGPSSAGSPAPTLGKAEPLELASRSSDLSNPSGIAGEIPSTLLPPTPDEMVPDLAAGKSGVARPAFGSSPAAPLADDSRPTSPSGLRMRSPDELVNQPLFNAFPSLAERYGAMQLPSIQLPLPVSRSGENGTTPPVMIPTPGSGVSDSSTTPMTTSPLPSVGATPSSPAPQPLPVVTEPFLVVDPATDIPVPCSTLAAAVAMAKDNWAIEIQPTTSPLVLQETLTITDKRLRLRPSRSFQPGRDARIQLKIDLSNQQLMGSLNRATEVLAINRGALEFYDLDIELHIDPASINEWALVSLVNGSRLTAAGTSITVVNPYNLTASVVSLPEADSQELADLMPERMGGRANVVELRDSVVRGQFDFLNHKATEPLTVSLQNTALALSGWVFRMDGANSFMISSQQEAARVISLSLDQVTSVMGSGLIKATSGEHGSIPLVKLSLNSCVFRVDQAGQPLIELSGHEDDETLRKALQIEASRNRSFFQQTGPMCLIDSSTSLLDDADRELDAEQLGISLADVSRHSRIVLREALGMGKWHAVQPFDLELRSDDDNPAIGASGDRQNAGVNWQALRLPHVLGNFKASSRELFDAR